MESTISNKLTNTNYKNIRLLLLVIVLLYFFISNYIAYDLEILIVLKNSSNQQIGNK